MLAEVWLNFHRSEAAFQIFLLCTTDGFNEQRQEPPPMCSSVDESSARSEGLARNCVTCVTSVTPADSPLTQRSPPRGSPAPPSPGHRSDTGERADLQERRMTEGSMKAGEE